MPVLQSVRAIVVEPKRLTGGRQGYDWFPKIGPVFKERLIVYLLQEFMNMWIIPGCSISQLVEQNGCYNRNGGMDGTLDHGLQALMFVYLFAGL